MTRTRRTRPVRGQGSRGVRAAVSLLAALVIGGAAATRGRTTSPGVPPKVDPTRPTFAGDANPVPAEPSSPLPDHDTLERIFEADVAAGGTSLLVRSRARAPVPVQQRLLPLHARARAVHVHAPGRARWGSPAAGPTGSARPAPTRPCTRSRSPTRRWRRSPPSAGSTRATGQRPHRDRPADRPEEVHHRQQRRGHAAERHQHRHRADHADGHGGLAAGDDIRRARAPS